MPNNNPLRVKVVIGSTRPDRFGDKPAEWIMEILKRRPELNVELFDLRDRPLPFYDEDHSLAMNPGKYSSELASKWSKKVAEGDAFIIVAAEYNHGYPAVLKNALDYAYVEWNKKPVAFVAYGSVGGARSVEQLRLVAVELQMAPVRAAVHIPLALVMDEKWNYKPGSLSQFDKSAEGMIDQVIWWGNALRNARGAPRIK